jgi:hypothetical protein
MGNIKVGKENRNKSQLWVAVMIKIKHGRCFVVVDFIIVLKIIIKLLIKLNDDENLLLVE